MVKGRTVWVFFSNFTLLFTGALSYVLVPAKYGKSESLQSNLQSTSPNLFYSRIRDTAGKPCEGLHGGFKGIPNTALEEEHDRHTISKCLVKTRCSPKKSLWRAARGMRDRGRAVFGLVYGRTEHDCIIRGKCLRLDLQ